MITLDVTTLTNLSNLYIAMIIGAAPASLLLAIVSRVTKFFMGIITGNDRVKL